MKSIRVNDWLTKHYRWILFLAIPLLGLFMHIHIFNLDLQGIHAWRQCETASNVLRFANEDMDIFQPHVYSLEWENGLKRMEFPIMQWVMAVVTKITGNPILSMRLVSWVIGIFSVWGMFFIVFRLFGNTSLALVVAWAFHFSPVFFYYTLNPLPDNLALMASIWCLAWFIRFYRQGAWKWLVLSAAMAGLAGLAKLPFVLVLAVPVGTLGIDWLRSRLRAWRPFILGVMPFAVGMLPAVLWYAAVIPTWHGNGIVKGILESKAEDLPELWGIFSHNLVSTLPELLLNYAAVPMFLLGLVLVWRKSHLESRLFWPFWVMALGTIAYFIFEMNMIGKAHDYYLFPFLPGLFLLVAFGARYLLEMKGSWAKWALCAMLLAMPFTAAIRTYPRWQKTGFTTDLLTYKHQLQGLVPADAKVVAGHDLSPHIFLYHLQKMGWNLSKEELGTGRFEKCIANGASHLYSSDREIDGHAAVQPYLGEMLGEFGVFRVFALKGTSQKP